MKKHLYLSAAAALGLGLAIAVPVTAQHNARQLRGAFPTHALDMQNYPQNYQYPQSYQQPQAYARQQGYSYQQNYQQSAQNRGAPYGLRGVSDPAIPQMGAAPYAQNYQQPYTQGPQQPYQQAYQQPYARPQQPYQQAYQQPYQRQYNPAAAQAFDRQYNVGGVSLRTNARHTRDMLDWQENLTGKTLTILSNRANGTLQPNSLYLGGGFKGGLKYQQTSRDGEFPILSRFPNFSPNTEDQSAVFAIDNTALAFTSTFGDWTSIYLQPEYSETEFARDQDEFQLRKAFVVFGNLERLPIYAAFGRKTIDFGNFDSYNAITENEGSHFFRAVADQPVLELGYYRNGFKLTGSAFSSGRQLRVGLGEKENTIGNFALSSQYTFNFGEAREQSFTVGGGYLYDTIYRDNFTAHTFASRATGTPPANFIEYRNGLLNGFAEYNSPFFDAMVEYTTTQRPWAAAIPQGPDGTPFDEFLFDPAGSTTDIDNINFDENLSVLVAQMRIKPIVRGRPMAIAATGSWGTISDDTGNEAFDTTFGKNQQHALSVEYPISEYLEVGAEYVYNKGFIPFVAPQTVSHDDTTAHAVNLGFKARF